MLQMFGTALNLSENRIDLMFSRSLPPVQQWLKFLKPGLSDISEMQKLNQSFKSVSFRYGYGSGSGFGSGFGSGSALSCSIVSNCS